jgi:hypothetical protein
MEANYRTTLVTQLIPLGSADTIAQARQRFKGTRKSVIQNHFSLPFTVPLLCFAIVISVKCPH